MSHRAEPGSSEQAGPASQREQTTPTTEITLNVAHLKSGGQLVRMAVGLSALTGTSITITNIRSSRARGGSLRARDLAVVRWFAACCSARTAGLHRGSSVLVFAPRSSLALYGEPLQQGENGGEHGSTTFATEIDVGPAGSIALVLQAVLPFLLFMPPTEAENDGGTAVIRLTVKGGTNVPGAPSVDYIEQVLFPTLAAIGLPPPVMVIRERGWTSGVATAGCAHFVIRTLRWGARLQAFGLGARDESSDVRPIRVEGTVLAPESMHRHFIGPLSYHLSASLGRRGISGRAAKLSITFEDTDDDQQVYMLLVATVCSRGREHKLGADELYQARGKRSHKQLVKDMVQRVTDQLAIEVANGACVDSHMIDQLVVYQALSAGRSDVWRGADERGHAVRQSVHADTAEWVVGNMVNAKLSNGRGTGVSFAAGGRLAHHSHWLSHEQERARVRGLSESLQRLLNCSAGSDPH